MRIRRAWRHWVPVLVASSGLAGPAVAGPFFDFSGVADVSAVQAEVGAQNRDTLRQQYTLNLQRSFTPILDGRASLRYLRFDLDDARQLGQFREEVQPSLEFNWRPPGLSVIGNASRRRSLAIGSDDASVTRDFGLSLRTNEAKGWLFDLRLTKVSTEDESLLMPRDTSEDRAQAGVHLQREHESLHYVVGYRRAQNLVRDLESKAWDQSLRFEGDHRPGGSEDWRLTTQYLFQRQDRNDEVPSGQTILERVEASRGLYALDPAPDQGELDELPGLVDGVTDVPTDPPVGIGGGETFRNLGVDLGFERGTVAAVYVSTDRVSDPLLGWAVYTSDDGFDWSLHAATPVVRWITALQRYEIEFSPVSTRYLKVVSDGVNAVDEVLVTEIEVFEAVEGTNTLERASSRHLLSVRLDHRLSQRLQASLSTNARMEPAQGSVGDRGAYDYEWRLDHHPAEALRQSLRWAQSWQDFEAGRPNLRDDLAQYTLFWRPLPDLSTSGSVAWRQSRIGRALDQENRSVQLQADARPVQDLSLSAGVLFGRLDRPTTTGISDTWTTRMRASMRLSPAWDVDLDWTHQETRQEAVAGLRIRRQWGLGARWSPFPALLLRTSLQWIDDQRFSRSQDYLASWRLGRRLVLSGQASIDDATGTRSIDRWSLSANLDLDRRTTVYIRYYQIEFGDGGAEDTRSWQQGFRTSF